MEEREGREASGAEEEEEGTKAERVRCTWTKKGMEFRPCQETLKQLLRRPHLFPLLRPLHAKM